jgi:uncharacterized protein involved in exopolysaccharide biosynthesis/Mrp family chromosome partitioning ATPase
MSLQRVQADVVSPVRAGNAASGSAPSPGPGFPTPGNDGPIVRLNLIRALQLHRNLALGIALTGLVLAAAYVAKSWPVYVAQSQIYIQPAVSKVITQGNGDSEPINSTVYDSFVQEQVQNASNPDVLLNALHKMGPGAFQKPSETEQAAAARLGSAVEVARVATSYEVSITAKSKDGALSAKIANAVAASIVEKAAGEGNAGDAQRITVLTDERTRIQNQLNSDYAEQADLNKQLGMAAVGEAAPDMIDEQIEKTREELIKAQTDHDEAEARYSSIKASQGTSSAAMNAEAEDVIASDAGLTSMKTSLNTRKATLISQMANLTPTNPEYKQDAEELAKINTNLDAMMKDLRNNASTRIQQKLRTDLERTAGVEAQLNGQLRHLADTAASATPKLQRVNDLSTDIVRLRTRYTLVDEQLHNLMLEDSAPGAVHLSVAAVAPLHPTASGIMKKALPVALAGLILGLLAASIANHLDPRVYIAADVQQVLGFAPMAVLPNFDEVSDEVASENLLRLAATIEHARKQGNLKSCIFTGTSSGTGVTTVTTRVRNILESMGRSTVLLDASGTSPVDHSSAMRGSRSTALVQQVAEESATQHESLVITDAAPLVISAETEYLARFVDCAIVVAESGVTTRAQLLAAVSALQRLDVATIGFVLNRVGLAKADPAFRDSLREIELHRRAQTEATLKRAAVKESRLDEVLSEPEQLPSTAPRQETPVLATAPAVSKPKVDAPAPVAQPAKQDAQPFSEVMAHRLQDAIDELPSPKPVEPHAQIASVDDSDIPWWLAEAKLLSRSEVSLNGHPSESPKPAEVVQPLPAEPTAQADLPKAATWEEPKISSSDSLAQTPFSPVAEPAPETELQPEPEENPYESPSKLNGLRGLLFSLGLKNLGKSRDFSANGLAHPDDPFLALADDSERTVLSHTFTPFAEPAPDPVPVAPAEPKAESVPQAEAAPKAEVVPESLVTGQPEFLPPDEPVPMKDFGTRSVKTSSAARDFDDDIRILPSKRGQYKRGR